VQAVIQPSIHPIARVVAADDARRFRVDVDARLLGIGIARQDDRQRSAVQAIEVAKRTGMRLLLAAAEEQYYHDAVKPLVDDKQIVYVGEVDFDAKVKLFGGARALLYPVQAGEPFGLVLAEAMACGTPVAALDRGAVREVVDDGMTGGVFADIDAMVNGLARVLTLDRGHVRAEAVRRFGIMSMVDGYVDAFHRIVAQWKAR